MARELMSNVWVDGTWYGPSYRSASPPPDDVNPKVFGDDPPSGVERMEPVREPSAPVLTRVADTPPPKSGPGSGRATWAAYAAEHGVSVPSDATRDEIVAACKEARVPTE